jgi:RNA polymerase sigma-70 factor (ECF subfamily)
MAERGVVIEQCLKGAESLFRKGDDVAEPELSLAAIEAAERVLRKPRERIRDPAGYAYRVGRNAAQDILDKVERQKQVLSLDQEEIPELADPSASLGFYLEAWAIEEAIAHLSPEDREIIQLIIFEDRSHKEAAARLGLTESASRQRLARARRRLRELLEENPSEGG